MRTLWATGAAIVVCLALGVPVAGQESPAHTGPVTVDVTQTCRLTTGFSSTYESGVELLRGGEISCDVAADDARLTGPLTVQVDCDCTVAGCSCWGATDGPQNEGGGWVGFFVSAEPSSAAPGTVWVSEGTGANEGWTCIETHQPTGDMVFEGTAMLYQGAPPLWAPLGSTD